MADITPLTPTTVGDMVRLCREEKHMTQGELADKIGIPRSTIWGIETNRHIPTLETLGKIAAGLDHRLVISMDETNESLTPASPEEIEMLLALRQNDLRRFMLMASAIVLQKEMGDK